MGDTTPATGSRPKRVRPSRAAARAKAATAAGSQASEPGVVDIHNQLSSGEPAPATVLSSDAARPDAPQDAD